MDEIIPHLYISDWYKSEDTYDLKRKKIKAIITIETHRKRNEVLNYYKENGIEYMFFYLADFPNANISQYFDESYKFINYHVKKEENTLVHCFAGISRSATLVLNYLIKRNIEEKRIERPFCVSYVINRILLYMRSKRSIINPNYGFLNQIKIYYS